MYYYYLQIIRYHNIKFNILCFKIYSKSTPVEKNKPSWKTNIGRRAYQPLKTVRDILNRNKRSSVNHRRGGGGGGGYGYGRDYDSSSSEEDYRNFYYPYLGYNYGNQGNPYAYPGYNTQYPGYSNQYPGYPIQYPGYPTQYPTYPTPYPGYSTPYTLYPTAYPGFPYTTTTVRPFFNFTMPPIFARSPLKKQDENQKTKSSKFEDVKHDLYGDDIHNDKAKNILNRIPQKITHGLNNNKLEIIHASFSNPENAAITIKSESPLNTASSGNNRRPPDFQDSFPQGPPPGMEQGYFPGQGMPPPDFQGMPQNSFPPFLNSTVFNLTQAVPNIFNIFNSSFNPFPNFPEMGRPFQHDHTRSFGGPNDGRRDDRFPDFPNLPNNFQMPNITQLFNNPLNFSIPGLPNFTAMIPDMPFPFQPPQ